MKYLVLKANGATQILQRPEPLDFRKLRTLVGGSIEHVALGNGLSAIVNEQGRLKHLRTNPFFPDLVGDVVVGRTEGEQFLGLDDRTIFEIRLKLS